MQNTIDLLILSQVCSKSLMIYSTFSCWFVEWTPYVGPKNSEVLVAYHRWFVDLELLIDTKIQRYRLQNTVDLLILYWVSSKCLGIDSAFCCWFVDFSIWSFWWTQKFRVTGCRTLLICWFYQGFLPSLWVLIARFPVDLLIL